MGSRSRSRSRSRRSSRGRSASRSRRGSSRGSSRTSRRSRRSGSRRSGSYRKRIGRRSGSRRTGSYRSRSHRSRGSSRGGSRKSKSSRSGSRSRSSRRSTADRAPHRNHLKRCARRYRKRVSRYRRKCMRRLIQIQETVNNAAYREIAYFVYKIVLLLIQFICTMSVLLLMMKMRDANVNANLDFYGFDVTVNAVFFALLLVTSAWDCSLFLLVLPYLTFVLCTLNGLHLFAQLFAEHEFDLANFDFSCKKDDRPVDMDSCMLFGMFPYRFHIAYISFLELILHIILLIFVTFGLYLYEGTVQHVKRYNKRLFGFDSTEDPAYRVTKLAQRYNQKLRRAKRRMIAAAKAEERKRAESGDSNEEKSVDYENQQYLPAAPYPYDVPMYEEQPIGDQRTPADDSHEQSDSLTQRRSFVFNQFPTCCR